MDMDLKCLDCDHVGVNSSFVVKFKNEYSEGGLTIYSSLHCPMCDSEKNEIVNGSSIKYYIMATITKKKKTIKKKLVVKKKVIKKTKPSGLKIPYNLSEAWCFKTFSDVLKKTYGKLIDTINLETYNANYLKKEIYCRIRFINKDNEDSLGSDESIETKIEKLLGNKFSISLERHDSYTNGTSFYKIIFDSNF